MSLRGPFMVSRTLAMRNAPVQVLMKLFKNHLFLQEIREVPSGETVLHRVGPFRKPNAPILTKHAVYLKEEKFNKKGKRNNTYFFFQNEKKWKNEKIITMKAGGHPRMDHSIPDPHLLPCQRSIFHEGKPSFLQQELFDFVSFLFWHLFGRLKRKKKERKGRLTKKDILKRETENTKT